jgi:hypothetical protein
MPGLITSNVAATEPIIFHTTVTTVSHGRLEKLTNGGGRWTFLMRFGQFQ